MLNFTPLGDLILVRPDPPSDKIGSVVIPQGAIQPGHKSGGREGSYDTFIGTVVAVGPGDRHKPFESIRCPRCREKRTYDAGWDEFRCGCADARPFTGQEAREWDAGRHEMHTKVGDRVVFPRRPSMPGGEFSVKLNGETLMLFHEQQSCLALLEF